MARGSASSGVRSWRESALGVPAPLAEEDSDAPPSPDVREPKKRARAYKVEPAPDGVSEAKEEAP